MESPQPALNPAELADVGDQLGKLLASQLFSNSRRKAKLLKYLTEASLQGRGGEISEYAIGLDVFDRPSSFDPRIDSTVRAEMSRLRTRLKEYYSGEGRSDRVLIEFGSRGYAATFLFRNPEEAALAAGETHKLGTPAPRALARTKWFRISAALALAALAVTGMLLVSRSKGISNTTVRSLVVLPFANLSSSPENDYLADGLTEELTNELAQWPDLRVVARTSAFQFKGRAADVRAIGRLLNVDAVLEGSIDRQGDRLRVTAQLNRASNGYHIWSHEFEARSSDTMALQDEVARSIASAMPGNRHSPREISGSSTNTEAHDLYLQGIYQHSLHTPDSYRKAIGLFQAATAKDPRYGNAYIGIARAEIALIHITAESPVEGLRRARQALEKAIELDPRDAEAHGQMANLMYVYGWDWPRAEQQFQDAIRDGAQSTTRSYYGWALATRGRFEEAHRQFRIAEDLDPLGMGPRTNEVMAYLLERKYGDAERMLHAILDRKPDALDAHIMLGVVTAMHHDCKTAAQAFEWSDQALHAPVTKFGLALSSACRQEPGKAREYLREAAAGIGNAFVSPYQLAIGYAYLGEKEQALSLLDKSAEAKEGQILYIRYDPAFDQIRSDRRFVALEQKVGLGSP